MSHGSGSGSLNGKEASLPPSPPSQFRPGPRHLGHEAALHFPVKTLRQDPPPRFCHLGVFLYISKFVLCLPKQTFISPLKIKQTLHAYTIKRKQIKDKATPFFGRRGSILMSPATQDPNASSSLLSGQSYEVTRKFRIRKGIPEFSTETHKN